LLHRLDLNPADRTCNEIGEMGYALDSLGSFRQILYKRKNVGSPCRLHDAVEGHGEPQRFII